MNIATYTLSQNEEDRVLEIYGRFKQSFSRCEFIYKHNIVGVGEPDKHLMCYFLYIQPNVMVKFKNIDKKFDIFDESIYENIDNTIALFKQNKFFRKERAYKTKAYISKNSEYVGTPKEFVIQELEKYLKNIDEQYDNVSFDNCSNRLRNVLYKQQIFSIKILKSYPVENIISFKNFGTKCLWELCEFLSNFYNGENFEKREIANSNTVQESVKDELLERRYSMLTYINTVNKKVFTCDIKNAYYFYHNNIEEYINKYFEFIEYLSKAALYKLTPREQSIFKSRFAIDEEKKTLQEIGEYHALSRERIRQIVSKTIKKIASKRLSNLDFIELEYSKYHLLEDIAKISVEGFLAYIYFECNNIELLKLVYILFFKKPIELNYIKTEFDKQYYQYKKKEISDEKAKIFNEKIYNLISYKNKRILPDKAFARLKVERKDNLSDEVNEINYNDKMYQYETFLKRRILDKMLAYNTFKQIKTNSLKIPYDDTYYYPDFQCLTHENYFVIVETKSLLKMCEFYCIKKFQAIKDYCERYGFGYLVIDDKNNSFFDIDDTNEEFNSLIMSELNANGEIKYTKYEEIYKKTKATIKNLLTLIKKENLKLSFPFKLIK